MNGRIKRPNADLEKSALPIIGKIKIGLKNERGFPQSVDYFIASGRYVGLFEKVYDKPQTIQIVFLEDDPSKVCREEYEYRDNEGRLLAAGDGETFKIWNGKAYETVNTIDYPNLMQGVSNKYPNKLQKNGSNGWTISLTLNFAIPCIRGVAGLWQFVTKGSASTIPSIRNAFDAMLKEKGFCKGIIFDLNVKFATTQKPNDKSKFPVVTLVANESDENILKLKQAMQPKIEQ